MKRKDVMVVAALGICLPCPAQVDFSSGNPVREEWVRHYGNGGFAYSAALALDAAGQVCVAGTVASSAFGKRNATVLKYDAGGRFLWVSEFGGLGGDTYPVAIASDQSGGLYLTGTSSDSKAQTNAYITLRLNSDGAELWRAYYQGPAGFGDFSSSFVVGENGAVYVTGSSVGVNTRNDFATIKYDSRGNEVWLSRYDNGAGDCHEAGNAVAIDGQGAVYVTGYSTGSHGYEDFLTVKYDAAGNQLWTARYNGPGNGYDEARAIAVDRHGNVYVAGTSDGGLDATTFDYAVVKYDAAGRLLWTARYEGPGVDYLNGMVLDHQGRVIVTGRSDNGLNPDHADYLTVAFSPNGKTLWTARFDSGGYDEPKAIALDDADYVYVTGSSFAESLERTGFVTLKYGKAGRQLWMAKHESEFGRTGGGTAIQINHQGDVYVTGGAVQDFSKTWGMTTIKYSQGHQPKDYLQLNLGEH